jgi:hypothetical protein
VKEKESTDTEALVWCVESPPGGLAHFSRRVATNERQGTRGLPTAHRDELRLGKGPPGPCPRHERLDPRVLVRGLVMRLERSK